MKNKKILFCMAVVLLAIAVSSCNKSPKSSMDEATEQELIQRYGQPFVAILSAPGTLKEVVESERKGDIVFLRVFGDMNGDDIAYLNECEFNQALGALDLLDAHLVTGGGAYYKDLEDVEFYIADGQVWGSHLLHGLINLHQLFLPQDITAIDDYGFQDLYELRYVRLPKTLKTLGKEVFQSSSQLESLDLPEGLTEMGESAFYGCKKLKSLHIPKSVKTIGGGLFGEFEHLYISWTPDEFETIQKQVDFDYIEFDENTPRGVTRFSRRRPTLHVPANMVAAYKERFRLYHVEADTEAAPASDAAEEATAEQPKEATINTALLGRWSNNNDPSIYMVLADKSGTYDERKGYGYVTAANDFYEYDFILVFTAVTPDGDNIKVHYNKMESYCTGDPDNYDNEDAGEWVEKKVGEGDLTVIPQPGGKVKIDSTEKRIKNKLLSKSQ